MASGLHLQGRHDDDVEEVWKLGVNTSLTPSA